MGQHKSIQVDDLVMVGGRLWKVVGCYYGALGCEDIIGLEVIDRQPGNLGAGPVVEMTVPLALIPSEAIFRPVNHDVETDHAPRIVPGVVYTGTLKGTKLGGLPNGN